MPLKLNGFRRTFSTGSGDLFNGFFKTDKKLSFHKENLIDARARRVFEMMGRACDSGVYPFQMALRAAPGRACKPKAARCSCSRPTTISA